MDAQRPLKVLVAAGGTGGHLFPARHIAQALKAENPESQIEFIGSGRPLEEKIIDSQGFRRHVIETAGVKGLGTKGMLKFALSFPQAVCSVSRLLSSFQPDVVIGVGGYVTVVPVLLAALRGIPTMIHEAEIHPGMANAFLARFVKRITVSFAQATIRPASKVVVTGQPVRAEMKRFLSQPPHLPEKPRKLLVVGGSLGARAIDQGMCDISPYLAEQGFVIVHQTRPESRDQVERVYQEAGVSAHVLSFIDQIDDAYAEADIIIARAGASTVMELTVVNRPVIFVPFPFAQDDHQTRNAQVLVEQGKALLIAEGVGFSERLRGALEELLTPGVYHRMVERPVTNRTIDAASHIATLCRSLCGDPG